MNRTVAVLDLGSQTFRLVIAGVKSGNIEILRSELVNVRLGEGLSTTGRLSEAGMRRGIEALFKFSKILADYKTNKIRACATAALRAANNGEIFLKEARRTGFNIEVLSGKIEAGISALGVYYSLKDLPELSLIVDAGGGSTEFVLARGKDIISASSLNIGAVSLTEMFLSPDPPGGRAFKALEQYIKNALKGIRLDISYPPMAVVGVGGSATTIGAMLLGMIRYEPVRIRGLCLCVEDLKGLLSNLENIQVDQRRTIAGLAPERADIIPAGIVIFLSVLSFFKLERMTITDGGLLFGLLMNLIQKEFRVHVEPPYTSGIYI